MFEQRKRRNMVSGKKAVQLGVEEKYVEAGERLGLIEPQEPKQSLEDSHGDVDLSSDLGSTIRHEPSSEVQNETKNKDLSEALESVSNVIEETYSTGLGSILRVHQERNSTPACLGDFPPFDYKLSTQLRLDKGLLVSAIQPGEKFGSVDSYIPPLVSDKGIFATISCPKCLKLLGLLSVGCEESHSHYARFAYRRSDQGFFES